MSQGAPEKTIEQKTLEQEKSGTSDTLCFAVIDKSSHCHPLYWISIDDDSLNDSLNKALNAVAVDPSYQTGILGGEKELEALRKDWSQSGFKWLAQRQFLPGVTDNLAHTIEEALRLMGISPRVKIASGSLHLFGSQFKTNEQILDFARYKLFHPLVESFKIESLVSNSKSCQLLPFPQVSLTAPQDPESIDLDLSDEKLVALSKNRLLALSLTEMRTIKEYFETEKTRQARKEHGLKATPTDVELEILAQTWSEHCKHKIFNADIEYTEQVSTTGSGEAHEHHRFVKSIYKTFIKGATKKLMGERADLLSVFKDNSGVVRWSDDWAVCFKVETHNSPSALEPFGGALTGILGVNRDILGTGLGASPIFNTNVFCFASP
ncbi:MAG: hypothetical protein K8F91_24695, partial [Candidatus Obscuribacterales bacterium]|nr:hypothetical protein [Candidatus Obscuribacterales bacterium]